MWRPGQWVSTLTFLVFLTLGSVAQAAPYAAMVMDARSGEVLHSRNADTRLHPASLTKMMTLYVAFEAVRRGEITLDTPIKVSSKAANEVPSKIGLRAGQKIKLRYLIRAAAVKSANDAATAIAEGISGSEAAFARRMNRTAKALGMTRTTFKNAHGLTEAGHLSTARDMTIMGRRLLYDYPQYYNLFSRRSTDAGITTVRNTNRRLLDAYRGADGIKTGYTRAAGFNLVASAERGNERIIATVFGGRSTATRNAKVAELLDLGFKRAPTRVAVRKPALPTYAPSSHGGAGKTIRLVTAVKKSLRPRMRPGSESAPAQELLVAQADIVEAVDTASASSAVSSADIEAALSQAQTTVAQAPVIKPAARPKARPAQIVAAAAAPAPRQVEPEIVTRASTKGGKHWGINVGRYPSRFAAEKVLLKVALAEMATLDGSRRIVVRGNRGFDATFAGLTRDGADLACRRLQARGNTCFMVGPG
ncbi:D-alanyl-D-alanine carboxypeptidase family protein [Shimia ponticola]|uniref:D-alanyl-D-alanine carboxypeptidase family protein n=1 Tax=Shimia ponticola TaxID=2582893 RepID=UPI0011BE6A70|nr:D-alanyl-D-alanine carboxypeptidase family protein [Shimia ponticola]